jgi:antitoxin VapB
MQTARIFINGNSQAVRLPKDFRFEDDEVVIKRVGHVVMLFPRRFAADELRAMLGEIGPIGLDRQQPEEQTRDSD